MSADKQGEESLNSNVNNSSKPESETICEVIAQTDDASPNHDDIEEIKCTNDTDGTSNHDQPDVYSPNTAESITKEDSNMTTIETAKWALLSPQNVSPGTVKSNVDLNIIEECNDSSMEEVKVKMSPLPKEESRLGEQNNELDAGKLDLSKSESATEKSLKSETVNKEITVKLPPVKMTEDVTDDGAELNLDTSDDVNNRSSSMNESEDSLEGVYQIKWVKFNGKDIPIITQNENGPCPLLAIMNVLLLKGKVKFPSDTEIISSEQMMAHLGECILADKPQNVTEVVQLNYEQNMHDAMAVIHKLQTGLDVNVRFNGVSEFEYTPECIIFDLLGISLYHGWLVDPQNRGEVAAIGNCSYNQLVEKIISQRSSENNDLVTEALVAEGFLDRTASQLTYHGLCELSSTVKPDQLCVFFRNNHFCTLFRHKDELFLLVTDQGFLHERNVVWETLNNVEGDHYFVDSEFHTYTKPAPVVPVLPPEVSVNTEEQVNHDYLLAMSLQQEQQLCVGQMEIDNTGQHPGHQRPHLSDAELAARLQAEEDAQAAHHAAQQTAQHHGNPRAPPGGSHGQQRSRERERTRDRDRSREKDSNCCVL